MGYFSHLDFSLSYDFDIFGKRTLILYKQLNRSLLPKRREEDMKKLNLSVNFKHSYLRLETDSSLSEYVFGVALLFSSIT